MTRNAWLVLLGVVLLVVGVAWWLVRSGEHAPDEAARAVAAAPKDARAEASLEAGDATPREPERSAEAAPESPPLAQTAAPESAPESAPTSERPPKDALGELVLHVVEKKSGRPIPDAKVKLFALRRSDEPGSSYGWPENVPGDATSDGFGIARLRYPAWVFGLATTSKVTFYVSHTEYPATQDEIEIHGLHTEATVELVLGCYLIVSGWIGSPDRVVQAVEPMLDFESSIRSEDWIAGRDGRLGTNRVKSGEHAVSIGWSSPEGTRYESRVAEFSLGEGEQRELALELVQALTIRGRLDDAVPRPVANGEVRVNAIFGKRGHTTALRLHGAKVASDGTFELVNLPPSRIELIALCDGWAATYEPVPPDPKLPPEIRFARWRNPEFDVSPDVVLVVPMTPTAVVELEVVDEKGEPIDDADCWMWPNVQWEASGYSQIYLDRTWTAKTDVAGRARLENLPAHGAPCDESYRVVKTGWEAVEGGRDGNAEGQVALEPGGVVRVRVVLKPKSP